MIHSLPITNLLNGQYKVLAHSKKINQKLCTHIHFTHKTKRMLGQHQCSKSSVKKFTHAHCTMYVYKAKRT